MAGNGGWGLWEQEGARRTSAGRERERIRVGMGACHDGRLCFT